MRSVLRIILLGFVVAPFIVGIPQGFDNWFRAFEYGAVVGFVAGLITVLSALGSEGAQKIVWAIVSVCVSVTLLDVALRPFASSVAVEPDRTYIWPPMPLVRRFAPNVRYRSTTYGGLARDARLPAHALVREYTFITDRFGFRNERVPQQPLDIIALGDSFTVGYGTTQDRVWTAILSKRYGLAVYNLGVSGNGPWQDYANLLIEIDRLRLKGRGTVAVWNLYNSALLRPCDGIFDKRELPWRTGLGTLKTSFKNFRERSPLGQLLPLVWDQVTRPAPDADVLIQRLPNGAETLMAKWDYVESHRSLDGVRTHPWFSCVRQTIVAMNNLAHSKKIALVILSAPRKDEVYPWLLAGGPPWSGSSAPSGYALAVGEIAREEHIPFLDLRPPLVAAAKRVYQESGAQLYWRDDNHWSVEGHTEVARAVHEFYESLHANQPGNSP